MRRLIAIVVLVVSVPTLLALGVGADGDAGNGYKVRQGFTDLDLRYVRSKTLPLTIN